MTLYYYVIKTTTGERIELEAKSCDHAVKLSGIPRDQIRPWYPFCTGVVPTVEDKEAKAERFKKLREMAEERKKLRNGGSNMTTLNPTTGEIEADFIRRQLTVADMPPRTVPEAGLKPKRAQNDAPLALEKVQIEAAQGRLF